MELLYEHILNKLKEQDSLSLRAKLQMDISSMSRINNIFSRTRKREIAIDERKKNERNAHKEVVILSEEEQLLNDEVVRNYEEYLPEYFPLVHPSPLNIGWRRRNPWFEEEVVPALRERVHKIINTK